MLILSADCREDLSGGGYTWTSPEEVKDEALWNKKYMYFSCRERTQNVPGMGKRTMSQNILSKEVEVRGTRQGAEPAVL